MKNALKLLGCIVISCMAAACSGGSQTASRSGNMTLELLPNYVDASEEYLKGAGDRDTNGLKSLMFIKRNESPTSCIFREASYTPEDKQFNATTAEISAGFAQAFSDALIKNPGLIAPGAKATTTQVIVSAKASISDYDAWLSGLRFGIKQSKLVQYFLDSYTLAMQVPGNTDKRKKFLIVECRLMGYPAQMNVEANEVMNIMGTIRLSGGK